MPKPTLIAAEPQIFVRDIRASLDFYLQRLGFQIGFIHGDPVFYAQVVRDGARLNLRHCDGPVFDAGFRSRERDALSAIITLDDILALFDEYARVGIAFHQALKTEAWGARTFIVADPDGNLLLFAARDHTTRSS